MQIKFDLKLSVYSLGLDIWLLSFKFYFGLIGWPPQPPREKVLKINKIVGFWWSISHWETRIGLFGAMVDGNIKFSNLFCEMRLLRSLRPLRLLRSLRPQIFQGLENHYWALQIHRGCWIYLFFNVLKTIFLVESWNIIYQFLHLFCWRLLRPAYVTFLKIGSKDQNVHISGFQNYLQI